MINNGDLVCSASADHAAKITANTASHGGGVWVQANSDPDYVVSSDLCDWGTAAGGDDNDLYDIRYQGGSYFSFDDLETFVCNIDGCQ